MKIEALLVERGKTHGKFADQAEVAEMLKWCLRQGIDASPNVYSPAQLFALDMFMHKIARIVMGNPNEPDHWLDIAGYATLVMEDIKQEEPNPPKSTPPASAIPVPVGWN
jgi:hypothetical protein